MSAPILTIAVAGCGSRGMDTYATILNEMRDKAKVVAAADIRRDRLQGMTEMWQLPESACYDSAESMLEQPKLADAMLICTPDACHYAQAKAALLKGYHLLLEKPIAIAPEECEELAAIAEEKHLQVVVCHVLRYTPFYRTCKQVIDSGVLGDLVSVQAMEQVCYWHQAHSFVRGNWRNVETSTVMILAKCCHDMDMMLWLTGKQCKSVSSYGSLKLFREENAPAGAPARCTDGCPAADTCPYNAVRFYLNEYRSKGDAWPQNVVAYRPNEENLMEALRTGPYGRCVYHCDNDVVDHQVVNMLLEDDVTVNFTMCAFTAHGGRTLRVMGTMGEMIADMKAETVKVMPFGREDTDTQIIDTSKLATNESGHGGGDQGLMDEFVTLLTGGEPGPGLTTIARSVESHRVCFAAEESRVNSGRAVTL